MVVRCAARILPLVKAAWVMGSSWPCFMYSKMISQRGLDKLFQQTHGSLVQLAKCHVQRWPRFGWVWKNTCLARLCPHEHYTFAKFVGVWWVLLPDLKKLVDHFILTWRQSWFNIQHGFLLQAYHYRRKVEQQRKCKRLFLNPAHHRVKRPHLYEGRGLFFRPEATDDMPRYLPFESFVFGFGLCAVAYGVQDHHLLLVTLLLFNTVANED